MSEDVDTIVDRVVACFGRAIFLRIRFTRLRLGFVDKAGRVHPIIRTIVMGLRSMSGMDHFSVKIRRKALDAVSSDTLGADIAWLQHQGAPPAEPRGAPGRGEPSLRRTGAFQLTRR